MKSLLNAVVCASLLAFAVGCGKENSSGNKNAFANLYNQGLSMTSQQSLQKIQNWYKGNIEGQGLIGVVNITKTKYDYNTAPNCEQKKFLGIPYQLCTYSSSSSSGTIVSQQSNVDLRINNNVAISSKGNQELNAIFSGASGTLLNAVDVSPSASQLDFLRSDGVIVTYIIDRNYHSALNPVKKSESSQSSKSDIIVTAQRIY